VPWVGGWLVKVEGVGFTVMFSLWLRFRDDEACTIAS